MKVDRLKQECFSDSSMRKWTFANDNGKCAQMDKAHIFVERFEMMREMNIGYLLWGGVGTGKSFLAGCIANAPHGERDTRAHDKLFRCDERSDGEALRAGMNISPACAVTLC